MNPKPEKIVVNPDYVDNPFLPYVDAMGIKAAYRIVRNYVEYSGSDIAPDHVIIDPATKDQLDMYTKRARIVKIEGEEKGAFGKQIAGNHYSKLKIQPMQYSLANDLNYGQANAIKYITRYKDKNGIEDLKKAIHCIELLIDFEENK